MVSAELISGVLFGLLQLGLAGLSLWQIRKYYHALGSFSIAVLLYF